jgi:hypothetical protein
MKSVSALVCAVLGLIVLSPVAQADLYQTQQKADQVSQVLRNFGYQFTPAQLSQVDAALVQALNVIYPQAPQNGCDVLGTGIYNGSRWNFRIALNGAVIDATDTLDGVYAKMRTLRESRVCALYSGHSCSLSGTGIYNGSRWNFIIKSDDQPLVAADTIEGVRAIMRGLDENQICVARATRACSLGGTGIYNGARWNFLIKIDSETVAAADSLEGATLYMNTLRSLSFCY